MGLMWLCAALLQVALHRYGGFLFAKRGVLCALDSQKVAAKDAEASDDTAFEARFADARELPLAWWEMLGTCTLVRLFMDTGTPSVCGRGPRRHLAWNIFDIALCFVRAKGLPTSRTLAMDALMKQRHCGKTVRSPIRRKAIRALCWTGSIAFSRSATLHAESRGSEHQIQFFLSPRHLNARLDAVLDQLTELDRQRCDAACSAALSLDFFADLQIDQQRARIADSARGEVVCLLPCEVLRKTTALHEQCEQMVQDGGGSCSPVLLVMLLCFFMILEHGLLTALVAFAHRHDAVCSHDVTGQGYLRESIYPHRTSSSSSSSS